MILIKVCIENLNYAKDCLMSDNGKSFITVKAQFTNELKQHVFV